MNLLNKKLLIFLISVTITNNVNAETVLLNVGQPAPYKGYLTDVSTTLQIREELLLLDKCIKDTESLNKSLGLCQVNEEHSQKQLDLAKFQIKELQEQNESNRTFTTWQKVIWSGIGVVGTVIAVYLAGKLRD